MDPCVPEDAASYLPQAPRTAKSKSARVHTVYTVVQLVRLDTVTTSYRAPNTTISNIDKLSLRIAPLTRATTRDPAGRRIATPDTPSPRGLAHSCLEIAVVSHQEHSSP